MLVMLLLLGLMPSALNLPQATPSETLEYAPVPPEDEEVPPPTGNFSSLGLGSSGSVGTATVAGGGPAASGGALPGGVGKSPSTKRCVGNPPRQTEDPLSPPCVAHFSGDNGGATYPGVTREEVRVLFYFEGTPKQQGSSRAGGEPETFNKYVDLNEPPKEDEYVAARVLRPYQRYFNERYQTYGRFVHFFAYFRASNGANAEQRRADAVENYQKIKPFAVVNFASFGATSAYSEVMLRKHVLVFTGAQNSRFACCVSSSEFARTPGMRWGTAASTEEYARIFGGLICAQVVGRPVTFGGNAADQGKPRQLGMINNDRASFPEWGVLARLVRAQVKACGGEFVYEAPSGGSSCSLETASGHMAEFQRLGVTTIIWPGGADSAGNDGCGQHMQNAGAALRYLPEVVVAGNGGTETQISAQASNQEFSRHQVMLTPYPRGDALGDTPCVDSAREADPEIPARDLENFGCEYYAAIRLLFTGIQVAGPRLGPPSMDKGYHAIPGRGSSDPYYEACFFEPGDYTCIKDAQIQHWDPAGQTPGSASSGCWRMIEGGARYLAEDWPHRDIAALRRPDDPCNRQGFSLS